MKKRVQKARDIQRQRFIGLGFSSNAEMQSKDIKKLCQIDIEAEAILAQAVQTMDLSARSYYRILKLSRTIADLSGSDSIVSEHILEALSYRKKED